MTNQNKKNIFFLADVRNWAFDNIAQYLKPLLETKYNVHILYSGDFKHPGKLLDELNKFDKIDYIHFFYRGYLKQLLEYIAANQIKNEKLDKFLKIATTTSIPDHLFINDQKSILEYLATLLFADHYYTTSTKLHNIYSHINFYPKPWKNVIFDNIVVDSKEPNFAINDKLVVTWIGNSAWGEWHFHKDYDPKGYHSVVVPTFKELQQSDEIEAIVADGHKKKRSKQEIFEILQRTDILLIAATTDGTPLPLIEAMASGCAIISTHNGIAPEVLPEIQQNFILNKDPREFISAIRELDRDRKLLAELKQQNFDAYKNIFCNQDRFRNLWYSLIEDSIDRSSQENRVSEKKQILSMASTLVRQKSFFDLKRLASNNFLKKVAQYLLNYKIIKETFRLGYSMLNSLALSGNLTNFKTTLSLYELASSMNDEQNNSPIYALYPAMFPGVANSTVTLFDKSIALPSFGLLEYIEPSNKVMKNMAKVILESKIKILVISGGSEIMFRLADKLHELKGDKPLSLYFLWHGSSAQWSDPHHLKHFYRFFNLYKNGRFEAVITLKKDLEKVLDNFGVKSYLLQNFIQTQPTIQTKKAQTHKYRIGIWSAYASWVKNLYPQILATAYISERVALHSNFKFSKFDNWIAKNLELIHFPAVLPHEELMNAMANTDITLYVTNTECSPMIALESLSLGIPCLIGPTSGLFDADDFLKDMLTVNRADCPVTISNAIERVIENYDQIKSRIPAFITKYNSEAMALKTQLLQAIKLHEEEKIFTQIYDKDFWTNGSGPGSHKDHTVEYRKLLQEYFNNPNFSSYIDLGCGDWQIMSLIEIPKNKIYKGYDIVKSVIESNKTKYNKKNITFYHNLDISAIDGGDLVIIKDVMIHWPNEKVMECIKNVLPKFKYALITNDYLPDEVSLNSEIKPGQFRYIDVTKPPFNLKSTKMVLEYISHGKIKKVYLYTNPKL